MRKVMVCYLLSGTQKVITSLILIVIELVSNTLCTRFKIKLEHRVFPSNEVLNQTPFFSCVLPGTRQTPGKVRKISEQEIDRRPFPLLISYSTLLYEVTMTLHLQLLLVLGPCRRAICIRSFGPFLNTLMGIHMICFTGG
jgi:hypothetical protein